MISCWKLKHFIVLLVARKRYLIDGIGIDASWLFWNFSMWGERYYFHVEGSTQGGPRWENPLEVGTVLQGVFLGDGGRDLICHTHKVGMVMQGGSEVEIVMWGDFSGGDGGDSIWYPHEVGMVMQGDFSRGGGGDPIWHVCEVGMIMRGDFLRGSGGDPIWHALKVGMVMWSGNGHARCFSGSSRGDLMYPK